jgi:GTP-binding protein Era
MARAAQQALEDADVILWILDASRPAQADDRLVAERLGAPGVREKVLVVLNKTDLAPPANRERLAGEARRVLAEAPVLEICATSGKGVPELLAATLGRLPLGQALYPEDQVTETSEREIVSELIREAALCYLREEVPHGLAVRVDQFRERPQGKTFVAATLIVEKESHKPILIGKGGQRLKQIGIQARREIESALGRNLFLSMRVKVYPNWREREGLLRRLGFRAPRQS